MSLANQGSAEMPAPKKRVEAPPAPTPSELNEFTVTRTFNAPRALVFQAFTDAKHLQRWWGPHGFTNPQARIDARPGGEIFVTMHGPKGTPFDMDMPMGGTVLEVSPPERLVFTTRALAPDGSAMIEAKTTLTLAERGGKTTMTLHEILIGLRPGAEPMRAGMKQGWLQSLEKLGTILGTHDHEIVTSRVIRAPREKVFAALHDAATIGSWWGPHGFRTTTHKMDFRPFGEWRFTMHGPDGRDYPNHVRYFDVVPPERIVFEHSGEAGTEPVHFTQIITLESLGKNETKIEWRGVFDTAAEREHVTREYGAEEGAVQNLERLAAYVEERTSRQK